MSVSNSCLKYLNLELHESQEVGKITVSIL